ncbi:MAG: NnrU family protein [Salaquimonas sp.]
MLWLVAGLIMFHGLHSVRMIAPDWREAQIASMGEGKWKGLYSLLSIVALVLLIYGYSVARQSFTLVYFPPTWGLHPALVLMLLAFVLMTFNMRSSRFRRIVHHPFLAAIVLWSVAHLLVNGDLASVLLFGSFLVWAICNWYVATNRKDPLPPVAPLFHDVAAIIFGIALWVLFIWGAHEWLFGVSPIA